MTIRTNCIRLKRKTNQQLNNWIMRNHRLMVRSHLVRLLLLNGTGRDMNWMGNTMTSRMTIRRNAHPMNLNTSTTLLQRELNNTPYPVRFQMRTVVSHLEWNRRNPFTKPTSRTYGISAVKEETKSISVQMGIEVKHITPIG